MRPKQPKLTLRPGMRPAPEVFEILYPPTEDGHLTEEMKKWPLSRDPEPGEPQLSQPAPPIKASEPKPPAQAG